MPIIARNERRPAIAHAANAAAMAALGAALVFTVSTLSSEARVVRTREASVRQAAGLATEADDQDYLRSNVPAKDLPARAALLRGVMRARAAAADPAGAAGMLDQARADIAVARASRPIWGEAEVARAYLELLAHGAESPQAIQALAQSYTAAPYLRDSAPWRIRFGVTVWPRLDAATRDHIVNETAWLAQASGRNYAYALGLVAGSPAEALVKSRIPA
ncbi:hypothetical protein [Sphingomonas pseudosanguinis]|uniref:Uncharacterized protein n=1 Tax=Sphingomonas pseudosanguinis TaxID=413712 RepID=A0A7W6A956_9SPHN|nr:hypothetical protein [Sphingomonas pseudosanguinis]MBB3878902.1 hypothetical protein [Sphingomonas pseudosanguinis]MBN3536643.1 hypothetical protein [Sphingomonas pseudosanguinis]